MAAPSRSIRGPGARTGSSSGAAIKVVGLKEFRKALRSLSEPKAWTKELSAIHKTIANEVTVRARAEASAMGGAQRHFAGAIRGYGTAQAARVGLSSADQGGRNWGANAAFWGVKDSTSGWNDGNSVPNLKDPWVGNSWDTGVAGQGPYAINDAVAAELPRIEDQYGDAFEDLAHRAFPD